jgi:hypothetical protein
VRKPATFGVGYLDQEAARAASGRLGNHDVAALDSLA